MLIPSRAWGFIRAGLNGHYGVRPANIGTGGDFENILDGIFELPADADVEMVIDVETPPAQGAFYVLTDGSHLHGPIATPPDPWTAGVWYHRHGEATVLEAAGSPITVTDGDASASVSPARLESTLTFGAHTVARTSVAVASPARIESTAAFGAATVARTAVASISPDRIEPTAAIFAPAISADGLASIAPASVESTVSFGDPTVTYVAVRSVSAPRIESTAVFGSHTAQRSAVATITPGRIDSTLVFGVPAVSSSGVAQIVVSRIASTVTFGAATVARTGGAGADAADIWGYVLSNGKTAEQTLVEIHEFADELHRIHGLQILAPLRATPTSRTAGDIDQSLSEDSIGVTVQRI